MEGGMERRGSIGTLLAAVLFPALPNGPSSATPFLGAGSSERDAPRPAVSERLPDAVYRERRARLLDLLPPDATAVLFTAPVMARNHDVDHAFRPASDFWYLTGFGEPGAALLLTRRDGAPHATLFVPPLDPGDALWNGPRLGVLGAASLADSVRSAASLKSGLAELLNGTRTLHVADGGDRAARALLDEALPPGVAADAAELRGAVGRLRLIKDAHEQALLQRAVDISCAAHLAAMRHAAAGQHEYELAAVIEATFATLGARRTGYESIVGSGANSCILHYDSNRAVIPPRATIVVDVGAEFGMYTADLTRTLPSDGVFTAEQRAIYGAVLAAQEAAIAEVKPGATIAAVNRAARRALSDALVAAGVASSSAQAASLQPHGVSHWLGLDVHDDCPYGAADGRGEVRLEAGMVLTVEPGCYVAPGTQGIDPRWHAIGVRIEDDVLVTADGNVVLSAALPKRIEEVEAVMAETSLYPTRADLEPRR
jgi:Xaa-Pro aminopeptidase